MKEALSTKTQLLKIIRSHSLFLRKKWGQNFLINNTVIRKITNLVFEVAGHENPNIWEIGAGLGALSSELAGRAGYLHLFEVDRGLVRILQEQYAQSQDRVRIIAGDAVKTMKQCFLNLAPQKRPHIVCGNLPYSSAQRLIIAVNFLCSIPAIYMVQKEVADRLCSRENNTSYGISSVFVQSRNYVSKQFLIHRDSFFPIPHVDSQLILCFPKKKEAVDNPQLLLNVLRAAFSQRRKMLRNTLLPFLLKYADSAAVESMVSQIGIDLQSRAEQVPINHYVSLTAVLSSMKTRGSN